MAELNKRIYCFFDLDNTIVKGQTQIAFLKYLVNRKKRGYFFLFRCFFTFLLYKLGMIKDISKIRKKAYELFAGIPTEEIKKYTTAFFENKVKQNIFDGMQQIIKRHKQKGHKLVIISAAFEEIVKKIAEYLNIPEYIATKIEIKNGLYTGKIAGFPIYGYYKIQSIHNKYDDIDYINSYAYADHISDKEFLELFGNSVVVNGNRLINSYAIQKGWKIIRF